METLASASAAFGNTVASSCNYLHISIPTAIIMCILSIPHIYYFFIWNYPAFFMKLFKDKVVKRIADSAMLIKVIQYTALIYWYLNNGVPVNPLEMSRLPFTAVGALLVAAGQILNFTVYKKLGIDGVYYGCKLGKKIKWVYDFPFNFISNPQYTGCILTILGMAFIVISKEYLCQGAFSIVYFWVFLYVISMIVESI